MEHQFKLLKNYLSELSDNDLQVLYHQESVSENTWSDLGVNMYIWIAGNSERGEWAILNEIARR